MEGGALDALKKGFHPTWGPEGGLAVRMGGGSSSSVFPLDPAAIFPFILRPHYSFLAGNIHTQLPLEPPALLLRGLRAGFGAVSPRAGPISLPGSVLPVLSLAEQTLTCSRPPFIPPLDHFPSPGVTLKAGSPASSCLPWAPFALATILQGILEGICCCCVPGLEAVTTPVLLQAAVPLSLLSSTKGIQLQAWPGQQGNGRGRGNRTD